jgi:hypothetical protein
MANTQYHNYYSTGGINTYVNPLATDGQLIHAVNVDSLPYGAKVKRAGYTALLDTSDGSQIQTLFNWAKDDGTSSYLYRASGSQLLSYDVGVGTATSWTLTGNGTISPGAHVGGAVLNNTLIVGDAVGSTRHSTNGTSFTNTTGAPVSEFFEQYQNHIYAAGTSGTISFSVTGDLTNWNTSGTSDGGILTVLGAGKINKLYKLADRLNISKSLGGIFLWDGNSLIDSATNLAMTSPYSYGTAGNTGFWINRLGEFLSNGAPPQLISNAIQRQIYNDSATGIAGTTFNTAPGVIHRYDYLVAVGSIRDEFTQEPINNCVQKYNYQKNEFLNWQFANNPTAFVSYKDNTGNQQLVFGDATGQCYTFGGTATSDNGLPIEAHMEFIFTFNSPFDKDWRWFFGYFNPGCQAQIQVACSNTFTCDKKNWIDIGDVSSGFVQFRFPTGSRSRFLYLRIKEASRNARFSYYGCTLGADIQDQG